MSERPAISLATPSDLAAVGRVHVQAWRETYPGIVPATVLERLDPSERAVLWHGVLARGGRVRVARLGEAIVGFGATGAQRERDLAAYPGEFYAIYLLRQAQGRGLGRAMMAAMAGDLIAQGFRAANLWVLDGNAAAAGFYAALGGKVVRRRRFAERDWEGGDTAYAWEDVAHLLPGCPDTPGQASAHW